jgi:hypothetical protein
MMGQKGWFEGLITIPTPITDKLRGWNDQTSPIVESMSPGTDKYEANRGWSWPISDWTCPTNPLLS